MANFRFYDNYISGQAPLVMLAPVAATQTLVEGDAVYLSSGQVTKRGVACGSVFGIMAEDSAAQAENTLVKVYLVTPYQRWRATADASAASALKQSKVHDLTAAQLVSVADVTGGSLFIWDTLDSNTDVLVSFTQLDYLVN